MAYEYEESNKQIVFTVDNESSMGELNERIKELEEVYRKAKAWDNYISELREKKTEEMKITFGAMLSRQVDKEVEKIERKYLEDE